MAWHASQTLPIWHAKSHRRPMRLRVREIRQRLGWTQQKLAEIAGLDQGWISKLERDHRHPVWTRETLEILAMAMSVPVHELFGYEHPPDIDLPDDARELIRLVRRLDTKGLRFMLAQARWAESEGMAHRQDQPPKEGSKDHASERKP